jgi:hypothetical protein
MSGSYASGQLCELGHYTSTALPFLCLSSFETAAQAKAAGLARVSNPPLTVVLSIVNKPPV